jgi:hypothetical protein
MKSKDRVMTALNHKTTDRILITRCHDFWIPETEQALLRYFNLKGSDTLDAIINFDVNWLEAVYRGQALEFNKDGNPLGIWGTPDAINTYKKTFSRPLADMNSIDDVER